LVAFLAILAMVDVGGRHHDHLALGLGEVAGLVHQSVVIGEEGPKLVGPAGKRQEHVRHEAGLLLNGQDPRADILRQVGNFGNRESG
jgi:hypothetical protein